MSDAATIADRARTIVCLDIADGSEVILAPWGMSVKRPDGRIEKSAPVTFRDVLDCLGGLANDPGTLATN